MVAADNVLIVLAFVALVGFSIYMAIRSNVTNAKAAQLRTKIRTLVESKEVSTLQPKPREIPMPLTFITSLPTSRSKQEIIDMMNRYETAGILFSTDPLDSTILQLERKLQYPDMQTIGDEKNDYSQYYYRVKDKDGFVIELNHNLYGKLVDGDIVASVPGYEGLGSFEVDIYDKKYTLQVL
uniref:Uncharacterized protein n=1 Tax=viral metagenome TaxID=1070528 RepID=A0A6C0M236_9ZZZZ